MKPEELSPQAEETLARTFRNLADETPADSGSRPSADHLYWRARVLDRLAAREDEDHAAARPARWGAVATLLFVLLGLWGGVGSLELADPAVAFLAAVLPPAALGLGWWIWQTA